MTLFIRNMTVNDIKQVQDVAKVSWNATYNGIIPTEVQENFLRTAYSDVILQKRLERSQIYVAVLNDKIVGFVNLSFVREDGIVELSAIYVYPEFQGQGVGSALLKEGIKHAYGLKEVYINVEKDNVIGRRFYEAKKFEFVKEFEEDFDGHILKTVRMVLKF